MAEQTTDQPQHEQVLQLHHGVLARWGTGAIAHKFENIDRIGRTTDGLLPHLAALQTLPASFGIEAFQIATLLASSARMSASLGPALRYAPVGDVADLVQVILEQEEAAMESLLAAQATSASSRRGTALPKATSSKATSSKATSSKATSSKDTSSAQSTWGAKRTPAPAARARAKAASAKSPLRTRQLGQVRLALQALRSHAADLTAADRPLAGATAHLTMPSLGHADPAGRGGGGASSEASAMTAVPSLARLGLREALAAVQRLDPAARAISARAAAEPTMAGMSAAWLAATPRALRLAEIGTEMAMLQPGVDSPVAAARSTELGRGAQAPARYVQGAVVPAGAGLDAGQAQRAAQAVAALRAGRGADRADRAGQPRALPLAAIAPLATTTSTSGTASLPALSGAVAQASALLTRRASGVALSSALRPAQAHGAGAVAARAAASQTTASATGAPWVASDASAPWAALTAAPTATAALASQRWLASAEAALQTAARPAQAWSSAAQVAGTLGPAALGAIRPGYAGLEGGTGDWLALGPEPADAAASAPMSSGAPISSGAPMNSIGLRRAATPAWLAPAAAKQAAARTAAAGAVSAQGPAAVFGPLRRDDGAGAALPGAAVAPADASVSSGTWPTTPTQAAVLGVTALRAWRTSTRLGERLQLGLDASPAVPALAAAATEARAGLGVTQLAWLDATVPSASVSAYAGALAADAGAGDWLDLGGDADGGAAIPGSDRASVARADAGRAAIVRVAARHVPAAATPSMTAPAVQAAAALLSSRGERLRAGPLASALSAQPGQGVMAFALALGGDDAAQALGVRAGARADALTPSLAAMKAARTLDATPRQWGAADAGAGTWLDLGADAEVAGPPAVAAAAARSVASQPRVERVGAVAARGGADAGGDAAPRALAGLPSAVQEAMRAGDRPRAQAQLQAALQRAGLGSRAGALAQALLQPQPPAALRAALALFGEADVGGAGLDTATRFAARWLGAGDGQLRDGRAPAAQARDSVIARDGGGGAMVGLRTEGGVAAGQSAIAAAARAAAGTSAPGAEGTAGKQLVVEGIGALAALRAMRGIDAPEAALLQVGRVEDAPEAGRSLGDGAVSGAAAASKAASPRASAAVRTHRFAPVALARLQRSLSRSGQRGRQGLVHAIGKQQRLGHGTVGYGSSALGAGPLLGLGAGDSLGALFGDGFASPAAALRAERLGADVHARRASRGGVGRTMPASGTAATLLQPGAEGRVAPLPAASGASVYGPTPLADLVSPQAAAAQIAAGDAGAGASASARSGKAASMARVLSVTAAPTAEMLPLVAPVARAVVAQAAAKPMAESIATSGANGSLALPVAGHGVSGGGQGGSGMGETQSERRDAGVAGQQEVEALAMKIARSVLVRIKRERERRGIHV